MERERQKQRIEVARQGREHLPGPSKETPKTSTRPIEKAKRQNLTLYDWMTVYSYVDTLSSINQAGKGSEMLRHKTSGRIVLQPGHTVAQTAAAPGDGSSRGVKSQCLVIQTTTRCHKT